MKKISMIFDEIGFYTSLKMYCLNFQKKMFNYFIYNFLILYLHFLLNLNFLFLKSDYEQEGYDIGVVALL